MKSYPTPRSVSCLCCNVCCDISFILLVRKEVLFIRVLKSYIRSLASPIVCVPLIVTAGVPSLYLPFVISHITQTSAPTPVILEVSISHLFQSQYVVLIGIAGYIHNIFYKYSFSYFTHQFGSFFFASTENDAADVLILIPLVVPVLIVEAYKKGLGQVSLLKEQIRV